MGNCINKVKHNCGGVQTFAVCTQYQGTVSAQSSLGEDDCLYVEEVIEDIYDITQDIYSKIDMTALNSNCITFTEPRTVKSVIAQMYLKICQLEDTLQAQQVTNGTMQLQITALQNNICN